MQSTVVITVVTPNHTSTIEVEGPSQETLDQVLAQIPKAATSNIENNNNTENTENTISTNPAVTPTSCSAAKNTVEITNVGINNVAFDVRVNGQPIDARTVTLHDLTRASIIECVPRTNGQSGPPSTADKLPGLHRYRAPRLNRRASTRTPSELWVVSGPDSGRRFPLMTGTQMIGRSPRVPLRNTPR
jgi:hypothetical protein